MARRFRPLKVNIGSQRIPIAGIDSRQAVTLNIRDQIRRIENNLIAFTKHMGDELPDILLDALRSTFKKSQNYTPVQTGELKASGYLEKNSFRGNPRVELGYGRGSKPHYAVVVHENLNAYHVPPTRAKFLQSALEEDAETIQRAIVKGVKEAAGT